MSDDFLRELSRVSWRPAISQRLDPGRAVDTGLDIGYHGADFIVTWDDHILGADIPFDTEATIPPKLLEHIEA